MSITPKNNNLISLRNKFIQKLMLNGKKATATILFDESLEILKLKIEKEILSPKDKTKVKKTTSFIENLQNKTKLEIFEIALNRGKP
jgi:ribosomal protein S7|tara:strand:+ start:3953 stop:4213 length:261 start_codon:yes stop_codon:yes gene_type:complete